MDGMLPPGMGQNAPGMGQNAPGMAGGMPPPQVQQLADQMFQQMTMQLQPLVQMFAQAQQLVQQKTPPPPPQDPQGQTAVQVAQLNAATQKEIAQINNQAALQRKQLDLQFNVQKLQMVDSQTAHIKAETELAKNDADNLQHNQTEVTKNDADNRTALMQERMRQAGAMQREAMKMGLMTEENAADRQQDLFKQGIQHEMNIEKQQVELMHGAQEASAQRQHEKEMNKERSGAK